MSTQIQCNAEYPSFNNHISGLGSVYLPAELNWLYLRDSDILRIERTGSLSKNGIGKPIKGVIKVSGYFPQLYQNQVLVYVQNGVSKTVVECRIQRPSVH